MPAGDQRMIAHMAVKPERHLHAAADVAIIAPTIFDHLVAQDRVGNPGDDPLKHVGVVELAGHPARALRLWPISDFGRERDALKCAVLPAAVPAGARRIVSRPSSLPEAPRPKSDAQL